jgi:hypothetical protein
MVWPSTASYCDLGFRLDPSPVKICTGLLSISTWNCFSLQCLHGFFSNILGVMPRVLLSQWGVYWPGFLQFQPSHMFLIPFPWLIFAPCFTLVIVNYEFVTYVSNKLYNHRNFYVLLTEVSVSQNLEHCLAYGNGKHPIKICWKNIEKIKIMNLDSHSLNC